jgi:alkylation response protein AidB-like acyl-CoA dehydrogenase
MTPNEEQRQFAAALHDLLAAADTASIARAWARGMHEPGLALWRKLGKLGVTALAVPESHGGLGADRLDLVVAFEELGHHAVPGPLIETVVVAPTVAPPEWLERIASGEALVALGPSFLDADVADLVLGGEPGPLVIDIDRTRRLHQAAGGDSRAGAEAGAGAAAPAEPPELGVLACAAQLLGLGRALLEMSVAYAKQRSQFGQAIGRYQAIKHQLANVYIALEFARPLLYHTSTSRDVSAAKVACGDAAYLAARTALQVHGAIGYTEEHDLGLYLTKVRALLPAWGTQAEHRARVMAAS